MNIYRQDGHFQSMSNIAKSLGTKLPILKFNTLKTIIPPQWRKTIKQGQNQNENTRRADNPFIKINTVWKPLENRTSQNINQKSVHKKIKKLTAQEMWADIFPVLESLEWSKIYLLPCKITSEPFLQSLQYQILNRILNCNTDYLNGK